MGNELWGTLRHLPIPDIMDTWTDVLTALCKNPSQIRKCYQNNGKKIEILGKVQTTEDIFISFVIREITPSVYTTYIKCYSNNNSQLFWRQTDLHLDFTTT